MFFWGPIPFLIELAMLISAIVGDWLDFGIISGVLFVNAGIGFYEEYQAGNAVEALKNTLALNARCYRDGELKVTPSRELVPGDVIYVRLGDIVAADCLLLTTSQSIQVDNSTITGESLTATVDGGGKIYSSAIVKKGVANAAVYNTGLNTFIGKTAKLVSESTNKAGGIQRLVIVIGNFLIVIAIILSVVIMLVRILKNEGAVTDNLKLCLVILIASIPAATPVVLSLAMAIGSMRMARKKVIITKLVAIEELSRINILCSDKTGTLTQNKLKIDKCVVYNAKTEEELLLYGALCSPDPKDDVIDGLICKQVKEDLSQYQIIDRVPFDPTIKRTESTVKMPDGSIVKISKGAIRVMLDLVKNKVREMSEEEANEIERVNSNTKAYAARGFRCILVCVTKADEEKADIISPVREESTESTESTDKVPEKVDLKRNPNDEWIVYGFIPFFDPPRTDSAETIENVKDLGIDIKMMTGDQIEIAKELASRLNIGVNILSARENLIETADHPIDKDKLTKLAVECNGFAEMYPEHKHSIVKLLQGAGHVVAMTGDGVNDSPALKQAEVGIAVANAADAARSAASIVLLEDGLGVIIDAIKESRKIFQRILGYVIYRVTISVHLLCFLTISILVLNVVLPPVLIVLQAILNDVAMIAIAYDNAIYSKKPQKWNTTFFLTISLFFGLVLSANSILNITLVRIIFPYIDPHQLETFVYLQLSISGHFMIFVTRTRSIFFKLRPTIILILAVIGTQILASILASNAPGLMPSIPWSIIGFIWGSSMIACLIMDYCKIIFYELFDPEVKFTSAPSVINKYFPGACLLPI